MAIAEAAVTLLVCLGVGVLHLVGVYTFNIGVILGALLGALITLINYAFLTISVDKAISNYLKLRGEREMTDEEAEKFAAENSMPIQNAIKTSFIIRTASILITLVVAFLTQWFNPLAAVIPLLAFRPLLTIIESIKGKMAK